MKKFEISCNMSLDAMEVQSHLLILMNPKQVRHASVHARLRIIVTV